MLAIRAAAAGRVALDQIQHGWKERNAVDVDFDRAAARVGDLRRMANEPEAGNVRARVHRVLGEAGQRFGRGTVQGRHDLNRRVDRVGRRAFELDGGGDYAGADGLREHEAIAWLCPRIRPDAIRIDLSRDGVPELDFRVLNGMAAEQRDARSLQDLEAAAKDLS